MDEYPFVVDSEPDIRNALAGGAVGLETYLRTEMRDADDARSCQRYQQIPLYLQHLLWRKSYSAFPNASAYRRLVNQTLKLRQVDFVTLNYDIVLDLLLLQQARDKRMTGLSWYTPGEDNWSLIKLHGSINWGRKMDHYVGIGGSGGAQTSFYEEAFAAGRPPSDEITLMKDSTPGNMNGLASLRRFPRDSDEDGCIYYPVLSVPLGPDDELSCPPEHQKFLHDRLTAPGELNLLVIGYSALDESVLKFLKDSDRPVGLVAIVTDSYEAGIDTATSFTETLSLEPESSSVFAYPHGFTSWVFDDDHGLDGFLASVRDR